MNYLCGMMESRRIFILFLFIAFTGGCKKDEYPRYSGTVTINNVNAGTDPTYYINGFHVPTGRIIADLNNKTDIITVMPDFDINLNPLSIYFSTNNRLSPFYKYGEYADEQSAISAFNSLVSFTLPQWSDLADNINPHQLWLFRTDDEKYAKIRVISTLAEKREGMTFPYADCTFEWVFQPDGSLTFPE